MFDEWEVQGSFPGIWLYCTFPCQYMLASFSSTTIYYIMICICFIQWNYSSLPGHLNCLFFSFLIIKNDALDILICVSLVTCMMFLWLDIKMKFRFNILLIHPSKSPYQFTLPTSWVERTSHFTLPNNLSQSKGKNVISFLISIILFCTISGPYPSQFSYRGLHIILPSNKSYLRKESGITCFSTNISQFAAILMDFVFQALF